MATQEKQAPKGKAGWISDGDVIYLVKFSDDPTDDQINDKDTIWLYNAVDKKYTPFTSIDSIKAAFGDNYVEAMRRLNIIPTSSLNDDTWKGTFIPRSQGVQKDGTIPSAPASTSTTTGTYGFKRVSADNEKIAANIVSQIATKAKEDGYISQKTFDEYLGSGSKSDFLAKATSALLYGGYSGGDIIKDLKAKELTSSGLSKYANVKGFDSSMLASDWYKTNLFKSLDADVTLELPETLDTKLGSDLLSLPLYQIPSEAFKTLVEPVDWTSPEFKAEAEQIQAAMYDAAIKMAEAQTSQAKAVANENYNILKKNIEKKYGVQLSNNAIEAWSQLENMFSSTSEANLLNSGFMNKAMDKYMLSIRKRDELIRSSKADELETEERQHLLQYGSPAEKKAFVDRVGVARARELGITPDQETLDYFSMDNLKKLFPEMSEEQLSTYRNMMFDENGNFTSELYQTLYKNNLEKLQGKEEYQQAKLFAQKLDEETKAYKEYTNATDLAGNLVKEDAAASGSKAVSVQEQPKPGYEAIPGVGMTEEKLKSTYAHWYTSADGQTLFGAKVRPGYEAIVGPTDEAKLKSTYSDWYTSPDKKTLYGKKITPKAGYEAISGPIGIADLQKNYEDWYTGTDKKTLYGKKKAPAATGISTEFQLPEGYTKIAGRPDLSPQEQSAYYKSNYSDIRNSPDNTFLYGKAVAKAASNLKPTAPATTNPSTPATTSSATATTQPAAAPAISASDSRYWSINPNKLTK